MRPPESRTESVCPTCLLNLGSWDLDGAGGEAVSLLSAVLEGRPLPSCGVTANATKLSWLAADALVIVVVRDEGLEQWVEYADDGFGACESAKPCPLSTLRAIMLARFSNSRAYRVRFDVFCRQICNVSG